MNIVVGMLGQDAQPIGQQLLACSPIPEAAPRGSSDSRAANFVPLQKYVN